MYVYLIYYKNYTDEDGRYIGCNDAFTEFVGLQREQILARSDLDLFGNEVGDLFRKNDLNTLEINETRLNKEWVTYPDGHEVLLSTLKTPFCNHHKQVIGILGIRCAIGVSNLIPESGARALEMNINSSRIVGFTRYKWLWLFTIFAAFFIANLT